MENILLNTHKKIQLLYEKKKYRKCLKVIKKIIPQLNNNEELFFTFMKHQGLALFHLGKYQEALPYLTMVLDKTTDEEKAYEINKYLFHCYFQISDYQNIINYGIKVSEYKNITLEEKANMCSIVARFYYLMHLQTNLKVYLIRGLYYNTEALKLYHHINDFSSKNYLYTLYDCADINFALEDYDSAISYYEKVEKLTNDNDILFGVYTNLTYIYKLKGYFDTMLFYKRKLASLT